MTDTTPIFSLEGISKSYSGSAVLEGVSFNIAAGDIAIILGANGAGKTTLIKLAVGLARPEKGKIKLENGDKGIFSAKATYLGHESMLYQDLTVIENIRLMLRLRGINKELGAVLKEWEIESFGNKLVSDLSRGMRYRVALCRAFLHDPVYIFLDEPTSALDQNSLELLSKKIKFAVTKKGGFAFIVTHDIERMSQIANRFVVLDQGAVAFDSDKLNEDLNGIRSKAVGFYHKINR